MFNKYGKLQTCRAALSRFSLEYRRSIVESHWFTIRHVGRDSLGCFRIDSVFTRSEPFTYLGRVMGVYPVCFHLRMVISVSFSYRRQCERMHTVPPFRYDYGCGYTYESERVAPRHGLFMGYIARFLHVFSYAFSAPSLSIFLSLSSFPAPPFRKVYFLLLRTFVSLLVRFSWTRNHFSAHTVRSAKKEQSRSTYFMRAVIGSFAIRERFLAIYRLYLIKNRNY